VPGVGAHWPKFKTWVVELSARMKDEAVVWACVVAMAENVELDVALET
jgi:hypothetical protein